MRSVTQDISSLIFTLTKPLISLTQTGLPNKRTEPTPIGVVSPLSRAGVVNAAWLMRGRRAAGVRAAGTAFLFAGDALRSPAAEFQALGSRAERLGFRTVFAHRAFATADTRQRWTAKNCRFPPAQISPAGRSNFPPAGVNTLEHVVFIIINRRQRSAVDPLADHWHAPVWPIIQLQTASKKQLPVFIV